MSSDNNSELKKIYSQRGNVLILKQGFKFSKYGDLQSGETGWKCVEKSCRAKLYTIGEECKLSRETGVHVHLPLDENIIMRQAISNRLKRKSAEYLNEKPSKLVELELNADEIALTKLTSNDIKLIKDNMYHARAKNKQNLPKQTFKTNERIRSSSTEKLPDHHENIQSNNNHITPLTTKYLRKKNSSKNNYFQENKYEEWPDWICCIEPHFLATDLIL